MDDLEQLNNLLVEFDFKPIRPREEEPVKEPRFITSLKTKLAKQKRSSIHV